MKKKFNLDVTRRQVLKAGLYGGAGMILPWRFNPSKAFADPVVPLCQACSYEDLECSIAYLSNPCDQPIFENDVPNALDPSFVFQSPNNKYKIAMTEMNQKTGLVDSGGNELWTTVWGYGKNGPGGSWPGMTFVAKSGVPVEVKWENKLPNHHLLPYDPNLHWAYALHGYTNYSIEKEGVPVIPHLHGGHNDFQYDGNPEFFFSPGYKIRGPQWVDGIEKKFVYQNDQPAGTLWYHDHGLGITRINVYAGLAGFYILRDDYDTGEVDNPLYLPAFPFEAAFAIQDRMFLDTGELFYPAYPDEPYYAGFIDGEDAILPNAQFPGGGPTALAEFFGDHMLVNGQIWPKMTVERRNYRLRFLNGCDSRFLAAQFFEVPAGETDFSSATGPLPFDVIGSDQGLASSPTTGVTTLLMETGSRYDIVFDFKNVSVGSRVIMKNIGGDEPFGGDIPGNQIFARTDRIMAFDVVTASGAADLSYSGILFGPNVPSSTRTRKVALFEGKDEFGRLQPLLGTAEPATDYTGTTNIEWPDEPVYTQAVLPYDGTSSPLIGPMEGSIAWHSPTTENPALDTTEEWEIWNMTGDAHPVHLHLVHFEVLNYDGGDPKSGRQEINLDSEADDDGFVPMAVLDVSLEAAETKVAVDSIPGTPPLSGYLRIVDDSGVYRVVEYTSYAVNTFTITSTDFSGDNNASAGNKVYVVADDGVFKVEQPTVQHNSVAGDPSTYGLGFRIIHPSEPEDAYGAGIPQPAGYVENARKDMVTALPGQITRIRAEFDKPGRYVWHCHILSHEDHEMMRVLHVGPNA